MVVPWFLVDCCFTGRIHFDNWSDNCLAVGSLEVHFDSWAALRYFDTRPPGRILVVVGRVVDYTAVVMADILVVADNFIVYNLFVGAGIELVCFGRAFPSSTATHIEHIKTATLLA